MTALAKSADWISPEEYIAGELLSDIRHEYIEGRVYAMAGASADHTRIAGNVFGELRTHLRGKRCEPFMVDMKVKPPPSFANLYYYPDVIVACDPTDNAKYFRERPTIIFEVLSRDTRNTDRREKALAYWHIATLEAYVLMEQEKIAATVMRRGTNACDAEELEGADAVLTLQSIDFRIPLGVLYERTALV